MWYVGGSGGMLAVQVGVLPGGSPILCTCVVLLRGWLYVHRVHLGVVEAASWWRSVKTIAGGPCGNRLSWW